MHELVAGDIQHLSQGSISTIVKRVATKFAENLRHYDHFPRIENEQRSNILRFYETYQFPSVAGCVDCTHIPIHSVFVARRVQT
ncbi:hypothetical protein NQ314_021137 [Rhamnusium bicolor]|uniref:Nuclease HARBI1 n=1 Tax=Rhamnusium bicolor TaxID=1586634 RepID=A0AAV8WIV8_9CUCU|nr:hypothetical protein NQ314_021137 [Rhamnusium bicolor]